MRRYFLDDERDFIDGVGNAFQQSGDNGAIFLLLIVIGLFVLLVVGLYFLHKYWHRVRGKALFIYHSLRRESRPAPRHSKTTEIAIQSVTPAALPKRAFALDVSETGMFVKMNPPMDLGEQFQFHMFLHSGERFAALAEVVWLQPKWTPHHPSGMGCRFVRMDPTAKKALKTYLSKI